MNEFDPYVSPTASCLTEWQEKIKEMRSLEWPYWKIAEWLLSEHQLTIHKDTIRKFCIRRNIVKGESTPSQNTNHQPQPARQRSSNEASGKRPKFVFTSEDEKPIEIH